MNSKLEGTSNTTAITQVAERPGLIKTGMNFIKRFVSKIKMKKLSTNSIHYTLIEIIANKEPETINISKIKDMHFEIDNQIIEINQLIHRLKLATYKHPHVVEVEDYLSIHKIIFKATQSLTYAAYFKYNIINDYFVEEYIKKAESRLAQQVDVLWNLSNYFVDGQRLKSPLRVEFNTWKKLYEKQYLNKKKAKSISADLKNEIERTMIENISQALIKHCFVKELEIVLLKWIFSTKLKCGLLKKETDNELNKEGLALERKIIEAEDKFVMNIAQNIDNAVPQLKKVFLTIANETKDNFLDISEYIHLNPDVTKFDERIKTFSKQQSRMIFSAWAAS